MYKHFFIFFIVLSFFVLQLKQKWLVVPHDVAAENFDPSGLTFFQNHLLTVSDKKDNDIIYILPRKQKTIYTKTFASLSGVDWSQGMKYRKDFEGIAAYGESLLITDEQNRRIVKFSPQKKISFLPLHFHKYNLKVGWSPFSGISNAGFEAIACDSTSHKLYIANERMFRHIYVADLQTLQIVDHFDLPAGNLPYFHGKTPVYPDYAGAYFFKGHLYLIYRNVYKVLKVNLTKKKIVAQASYKKFTKNLYLSSEIFGLAEGLAINENSIFLILDNNGDRLRSDPTKKNPMLLEFKRPKGF